MSSVTGSRRPRTPVGGAYREHHTLHRRGRTMCERIGPNDRSGRPSRVGAVRRRADFGAPAAFADEGRYADHRTYGELPANRRGFMTTAEVMSFGNVMSMNPEEFPGGRGRQRIRQEPTGRRHAGRAPDCRVGVNEAERTSRHRYRPMKTGARCS